MNKKPFHFILGIATTLLLFASTINAQNWEQLTDFPSSSRDDGVVFVIGDTAYCGTGLNAGWAPQRDFYAFDMNAETWSTVESLPTDKHRQYACAFASSNRGYVFGGQDKNGYLNDLWEYDPILNTWTEKTPLPDLGRGGSSFFVIDSIAYITGGKNDESFALKEVWAYNINQDTWEQKNDLSVTKWRASAAATDLKGYLLFGSYIDTSFSSELFEYDPIMDSWSVVSTFPNVGRTYASINAIGNSLYIFGGQDSIKTFYNDMWQYKIATSTWLELDSLPAYRRRGGMSFNNGTNIFYTTGVDQTPARIVDIWKYALFTGLGETVKISSFKLYTNPTVGILYIECDEKINSVEIYNSAGQLILMSNQNKIDLSGQPLGIYFIHVKTENQTFSEKVIVE